MRLVATPAVWEDAPLPTGTEPVSARDALRWMQDCPNLAVRAPIGVVGPREEDGERNSVAEAVGRRLGEMGFTVICGGRSGVMEAVSRGVASVSGLIIGLLPGDDPAEANPYVRVPIATGIGEARNVVIARAAAVLVVVGDSYGTLSEVALGLRFEKPVFGLCNPPKIDGVRPVGDIEALTEALAQHFLG